MVSECMEDLVSEFVSTTDHRKVVLILDQACHNLRKNREGTREIVVAQIHEESLWSFLCFMFYDWLDPHN